MTLIGLMPQTWAADLGRGGLASYEVHGSWAEMQAPGRQTSWNAPNQFG